MKRSLVFGLFIVLAVSSLLILRPPLKAAVEATLNGHTFTLPDGFEIELVAGPPLVDRPIVADFDEQGRLYVADSSGSNDRVQKQLEEKPHRIVRLEDSDGDGRFDKRTLFADKMMFPEGAMWFDGSLYVSAPPSIWKLTDTNDDGVADERVEWFQGKTLTNCANDLHGPYLGRDGWIYWCKGAFAKQTYERPGKAPFVTRAAHIFRCRPDGSGIEPVMTGGMDNPVDVVFTPGGERIFTCTFLQNPGGGHRDGLIHAVYGAVYGKVHDVIDEHPRTSSEVMPPLTHLGPAAPCGLTLFESSFWGDDYQGNLFAALFNLQKVTRHVVAPDGATFKTKDEDFLVSTNRDFHPTDVLEDADGSLVVIDTGGWYKLCCPTSQLSKPDVLGAIYRVRKQGTPRIDDPRGLKLAWSTMPVQELIHLLADRRPAVRNRAIQSLARKGEGVVPALTEAIQAGTTPQVRLGALWAATRIDRADTRGAVRKALADPDETVRQAAIHSMSLWKDRDAAPALIELLKGRSQQNERAAAEALGRIGDKTAVPVLLEQLSQPLDRVLEHSLTFALIEIADPQGTALGLKSPSVHARRAALVALDQMEKGGLEPATVAPLLVSSEPILKDTASWIVSHHSDWGDALSRFYRQRLGARNLSDKDRAELEKQLAQFARAASIQELLSEFLRDDSASRETRRLVLAAMAQSNLRQAPNAWIAGLSQVLESGDAELVKQAVAAARSLRIAKDSAGELAPALLKVARNGDAPVSVRLDALAAVPGGLAELSPELFGFLCAQLQPDGPVAVRSTAAEVFSKAKLTVAQLGGLTELLKTAGPLEMDRLLTSFDQSTDDTVGLNLLSTLRASPSLSFLRVETLKPHLLKYSPRVQQQAEELYSTLNADAAKQKVRLEELLFTANNGDIRRGQAVFNNPKVACVSCHAIGYLGGNIGPDLTRIGQIRTERDLLEAVIFPSASFVRSYEPVVIATKDGKVLNGVIRKDAADELVLATGPNELAHIPRDDIDEMRASSVSVMPAGLNEQLSTQDIADLLAFLKACR
jgi:putative membrane-bound dehydrogenase-like protein